MKTIIITGGAGFIGSNFVYHMLKTYDAYKVVVFDSLTYAGHRSTLRDAEEKYSDRFIFENVDICDRAAIVKLVQKYAPNFVVNFAAESHVDRSLQTPEVFLRTNILGVQVLMDACRKYGVERFHQVSTDEVFGDLPLAPVSVRFTEETPYNPSSPYSASKASADHLVRAYGRSFELPYTISNCSNNYGPFHHPEKIIPLFITNLINGKKVPLYGSGTNVRDWLYVQDHCRAIDVILHSGRVGETYLVGGNEPLSNNELAHKILLEMGYGEEMIEHVPDRKGHDLRYDIDYSKIKKELGWEPEVTFDKGLKETVKWFRENEWWWREFV